MNVYRNNFASSRGEGDAIPSVFAEPREICSDRSILLARMYDRNGGGNVKSKSASMEESILDAPDRLRHDLIRERYIW